MDIRVEGLRLDLGRRTILEIDQLLLAHGTTTALFGPNGAGKTSLVRLLSRLQRPTAGRIVTSGPGASDPFEVALAFQRPVFLRGTVRDNLELGLSLRQVPPTARRAVSTEAARAFGIDTLLDQPARTLSAGEAQRANLARALCLRAPLTLLDEPLSALDRVGRARLLEELPHLLQAFTTTTVVVTHDREEAFRLAEYLVVMVDGRIRATGRAGDVYRRPADRLTAELLGYTVVTVGAGVLAIPPGGLVISEDSTGPDLLIERVVDMGNHRDVVGILNGTRVMARLLPGVPAPARGAVVKTRIQSSVTW
jgi:ABC-type sugar transport system ATPase subunit